jgi:uncharacterized protein (UPF0332 family)
MAFADDLLDQAYHLARKENKKPKQASLRCAVSTAYYALFHLLIEETVANWKRTAQRARLARAFEHRKMMTASKKVTKSPFPGGHPATIADLKKVAHAFVQLQEHRHMADYDNSTNWSRTQALAQINLAADAFRSWRSVRAEAIAQEYLLWFLVDRP